MIVEHTGVNRRERTLVLTSRGTTSRYRHLMLDATTLLPNAKRGEDGHEERTVGGDRGGGTARCTNALFFECRKRQDCYVWMAKTPSGPSIKFHAENAHTMAELKMTESFKV